MANELGRRLEQYTAKHPQEVLIVNAEIAGVEDQITIFKGYSSSLTRPTSFDPDVPVLPDTAKIINVDRVASPYNPREPRDIERGLTGETLQQRLEEAGI